jgi:hypothetical protein
MANLHEAVINVLKTPQEIFDLIGDDVTRESRAFGIQVPKAQAIFMPRKCIVVRQSGQGGQNQSFVRLQKTLLDIICYGETGYEAELLRLEVNRYLKDFRRRMSEGFLLHSFDLVNGPIHLPESQTEWPYVLETWRCLASET